MKVKKNRFRGDGFLTQEELRGGVEKLELPQAKGSIKSNYSVQDHSYYPNLFVPEHEVWKTLPNSDNRHQVSTFGRVRSIIEW